MGSGSFTHFRKFRRVLCLAAVASQVLMIAGITMIPLSRGSIWWISMPCFVLAFLLALLLPMEEMTNARLAARGWTPAETGADLIRAVAVMAMVLWFASLPEFWPLLNRIYDPSSWGWQVYFGIVLWFVSRAYRQCFAIMALNDRQIYRHYAGPPADESGTQSFRKIG